VKPNTFCNGLWTSQQARLEDAGIYLPSRTVATLQRSLCNAEIADSGPTRDRGQLRPLNDSQALSWGDVLLGEGSMSESLLGYRQKLHIFPYHWSFTEATLLMTTCMSA
jgi:hypothetical protein